MEKTVIAALVAKDLEAEFKRYTNSELQGITAVNDGQHGECKPLPEPTEGQLAEAFKVQRYDWWNALFDERVTLDQAAGMLLGFSQIMAMNAKFVDAHKSNPRAPSRPVSSYLVKAFTDMRGDIADWRVTSDGKYRAADLIAWAKEKGYVVDEVLAEWEAYNKAGAVEARQVTAPAQAASPTPVMADSASEAPAWTVSKPQRFHGYSMPLYSLLAAACREGKPRLTARDVVEAWRINKPAEVAKVLPDGFDYYDAQGNTKHADLEAIRKAIGRMISDRQSR